LIKDFKNAIVNNVNNKIIKNKFMSDDLEKESNYFSKEGIFENKNEKEINKERVVFELEKIDKLSLW
jgi:hypothetical protein